MIVQGYPSFKQEKRLERFRECVFEYVDFLELQKVPYLDLIKKNLIGDFLSKDEVLKVFQKQLPTTSYYQVPDRIAVVTPSTGYVTAVYALFWPYVLGAEVLPLLSTRDPYTYVFCSMLGLNSNFTPSVLTEEELKERLSDIDKVLVYGSDETVRFYRRLVTCPVFGFGSKFSISLLPSGFSSEGLYEDVTGYDGVGCLNTSVVFTDLDVKQFRTTHKELISRLDEFSRSHREETDRYVQSHLSLILEEGVSVGGKGIFFLESGRSFKEKLLGGGFGTLCIVQCRDFARNIPQYLQSLKGHLSSVSYPEGFTPPFEVLTRLGASRFCHLGEQQNPTLWWVHDGVGDIQTVVTRLNLPEDTTVFLDWEGKECV